MEAVIFDMDGVIVDTEPGFYIVANKFLSRYGKSITKEYFEQFFGGASEYMWKTTTEMLGLEIPVEECVKGAEEIRKQRIREEGYEAIEGTLELIREIHRGGIPLAVASSSSKQDIEQVMDYFGIRQYFRALVSGKECEHPKPAPDVFLRAAGLLGTEPEQCLVIEDSNNGVTAAKKAGMSVIGFRNLAVANQELKPADHIVTSMKDITLELCRSF
ncbi:HAD family hydrolase [Anaerostipes sp.]|uniref:HAD family hydrolase n=1 Tax=Anaerostipes sp. TaxID=1872530 RepID=UPI0025B8A506|nr:HAD family hydrolase [Anaerostipes sp.]MBS7007536.1 HAD family hydrolase [Anaerostipes sp.]